MGKSYQLTKMPMREDSNSDKCGFVNRGKTEGWEKFGPVSSVYLSLIGRHLHHFCSLLQSGFPTFLTNYLIGFIIAEVRRSCILKFVRPFCCAVRGYCIAEVNGGYILEDRER